MDGLNDYLTIPTHKHSGINPYTYISNSSPYSPEQEKSEKMSSWDSSNPQHEVCHAKPIWDFPKDKAAPETKAATSALSPELKTSLSQEGPRKTWSIPRLLFNHPWPTCECSAHLHSQPSPLGVLQLPFRKMREGPSKD